MWLNFSWRCRNLRLASWYLWSCWLSWYSFQTCLLIFCKVKKTYCIHRKWNRPLTVWEARQSFLITTKNVYITKRSKQGEIVDRRTYWLFELRNDFWFGYLGTGQLQPIDSKLHCGLLVRTWCTGVQLTLSSGNQRRVQHVLEYLGIHHDQTIWECLWLAYPLTVAA